ncbi:MAG: hypothetical protein IAE82_08685 [Opitutaceae bacterium]|nr:hypothetical protein [Opitutaceae bacterium]
MKHFSSRTLGVAVAGIVSVALTACGPKASEEGSVRQPDSTAATHVEAGAANAPDGEYPFVGAVVSINAERGTILVRHEAVPPALEVGVTDFKADPAVIASAVPGARLTAVLVKHGRKLSLAPGTRLDGTPPAP